MGKEKGILFKTFNLYLDIPEVNFRFFYVTNSILKICLQNQYGIHFRIQQTFRF